MLNIYQFKNHCEIVQKYNGTKVRGGSRIFEKGTEPRIFRSVHVCQLVCWGVEVVNIHIPGSKKVEG